MSDAPTPTDPNPTDPAPDTQSDAPNLAAERWDWPRKELPVGISHFKSIRQEKAFYADKTQYLFQLVQEPGWNFLARPRFFGKSLLVYSLECLLKGQKELFNGLWIADTDYSWTPYPVIRLEMSLYDSMDVKGMDERFTNRLSCIAEKENVKLKATNAGETLTRLIELLYQKTGQKVAVLIDAYDKLILRRLRTPKEAQEVLDFLRDFYGTLKTSEDLLSHVFITGIMRLAFATIFPKLDKLKDITFAEEYANVGGFTEAELDNLFSRVGDKALRHFRYHHERFKDYIGFKDVKIEGVEYLRGLLKKFYYGHTFVNQTLGDPNIDDQSRLYNPFAVFRFLEEGQVESYWIEWGSPSHFMDLNGRRDENVFQVITKPQTLNAAQNYITDVKAIDPVTLLFQTGYLAIKEVKPNPNGPPDYLLFMPNQEIRDWLIPLADPKAKK
ncbi:MAG: AAA family ATPase [Deltaproteobacteria bacterium]|jgi:hypothetical protein|nr:AAA family ATPase [Deltaproteobacteria bacterium]